MNHKYHSNTFLGVLEYRLCRKKGKINRSVVFPNCQVRDMVHTNLNPYIGVCIASPNVSIISHYCYRGSLEVRHQLDNIIARKI